MCVTIPERKHDQRGIEGFPAGIGETDHVVLFDGLCGLCTRFTRFIVRCDRRRALKLCSLQSPEGVAILEWFSMPPDRCDTVLLVEGHSLFERSDAVLLATSRMGFPWGAVRVFRLVPRAWRDALYNWVARNRYRWFGKLDHCILPTPETRERFLGDPR